MMRRRPEIQIVDAKAALDTPSYCKEFEGILSVTFYV